MAGLGVTEGLDGIVDDFKGGKDCVDLCLGRGGVVKLDGGGLFLVSVKGAERVGDDIVGGDRGGGVLRVGEGAGLELVEFRDVGFLDGLVE